MYIDPEIVLFHDIISDDERESVLKIAENKRLKRSFVQINATFGTAVSYRVSKQTWIEYEDYDVTRRIARRISSVTGLDLTYGEPLQVANYGIGGHYNPHYDFLTRGDLAPGENITRNRYATVLFYISDVTQGGATVFPHLGVYVKPFKNTAVYWINLYSSCEGNFALMHAACPVLQGSKWISTIWVEQIGQELIRPCGTEYQHEGFHRLHTAKRKNNAKLSIYYFRHYDYKSNTQAGFYL